MKQLTDIWIWCMFPRGGDDEQIVALLDKKGAVHPLMVSHQDDIGAMKKHALIVANESGMPLTLRRFTVTEELDTAVPEIDSKTAN